MLSLISGFEETGPEQEWLNKAELLGFSVFWNFKPTSRSTSTDQKFRKNVCSIRSTTRILKIFGRMESALWSDIFLEERCLNMDFKYNYSGD